MSADFTTTGGVCVLNRINVDNVMTKIAETAGTVHFSRETKAATNEGCT